MTEIFEFCVGFISTLQGFSSAIFSNLTRSIDLGGLGTWSLYQLLFGAGFAVTISFIIIKKIL